MRLRETTCLPLCLLLSFLLISQRSSNAYRLQENNRQLSSSSALSLTSPQQASVTAPGSSQAAVGQSQKKQQSARGNPIGYNFNWPWAKAGQGRCTKTNITIPVRSLSDFSLRLKHAARKTVILVLHTSFSLNEGLVLDGRYACTIVTAAKAGVTLKMANMKTPVLWVSNTSNVIVTGINFEHDLKRPSACRLIDTDGNSNFMCPTVLVSKSYGVQIAKGKVTGRVQLVKCMHSSIDSMDINNDVSFESSPGGVRVLLSGYGPTLLRSGVSISNNKIHDVNDGIVLHLGAVGVEVYNNRISRFGFAGIRCGDYFSQQGDCMLSAIFRNLVFGRIFDGTAADTGAIYFNTHYFNPGNIASCNYVYGADSCYYLDNQSSGISILGGACIHSRGGVKINGGKRNIAKWLVMKNVTRDSAWAQCLFTKTINCNNDYVKKWEAIRKKWYNSPQINQRWPWMASVCSATSANGGMPCNPPGTASAQETGKCSGLSTDNFVDIMGAQSKAQTGYAFCDDYPQIEKLNVFTVINRTWPSTYQFVNYQRNNLAVKQSSPVYNARPRFRSCPSTAVGPKGVRNRRYLSRFNIPRPNGFNGVINTRGYQVFKV